MKNNNFINNTNINIINNEKINNNKDKKINNNKNTIISSAIYIYYKIIINIITINLPEVKQKNFGEGVRLTCGLPWEKERENGEAGGDDESRGIVWSLDEVVLKMSERLDK